jgi:ribosomal RNA-processing protein 12
MIIDEDSDSDGNAQNAAATDAAGTAYRESITSVDGFTRGPNGRVKFNKDTKKRRRENEDMEGDVEMADGDVGKGRKGKRHPDVKLGHEFKAKACLLSSLLELE